MMYGLSKAGFKTISESIRAYTTCILSAQLAAHAIIVGSTASALGAQAEFLKALESYIMRPKDIGADITHCQNILSDANSTLNFPLAPGLYLILSDLSLKTDLMREYNNALLQAPPSAFGLVGKSMG